ncbi:MAG: hypothetical protein V1909_04960 [Candidatus Micrarchaeota archaeon]
MTTLFPMSSVVSPGAQVRAAMAKEMSEDLPRIRKFLVSIDSSFSGTCSGFGYLLTKNKNSGEIEVSFDFPSPYNIEVRYYPKGLSISDSVFGKLRRFIVEALKSGKIYLNFLLRTDNLPLAKPFCDRNTEYLEKLLEESGNLVKIKDGKIAVSYPYRDKDIADEVYRSKVANGLQGALETLVNISKGES